MKNFKVRKNSVNARCATVIASEEAKGNSEIQSITFEILRDISSWDTLQSQLMLRQNDLLQLKKEVKISEVFVSICAADSSRMIESLKPFAEANLRNITNKTELQQSKQLFREKVEILLAQNKEKRDELIAHGYSILQVDELEKAFNKYKTGLDKVTLLENEIKQLNNKSSMVENEVEDRFNLLNTIVMVNKMLMPKLYDEYFKIRLSTGKSNHVSVMGTISWNGEPLANANVKLYQVESNQHAKGIPGSLADIAKVEITRSKKAIFEKLTNIKGEFSTRKLKPGEYKGVISKNGHVTEEVMVYVNPKETTSLSINLDKIG